VGSSWRWNEDTIQAMKVLVTGASGFVGRHRVAHLLEQGHDVISISGTHTDYTEAKVKLHVDIAKKNVLDYIVAREKPERIEHFASIAIVAVSRTNPYATYRTNVLGCVSVLETAKTYQIPIMVMVTDKYYGNLPIAGEDDRPVVVGGAYETSKYCQDIISQAYRKLGAQVTIVRSANLFGANDENRRIIPNTLRALQKEESPIIFKNHLGVRQYVYIKDFLSALDCVLSNSQSDTFNIGTEIRLSQEEVVNTITDLWNEEHKTHIVPAYKEAPNIDEIPEQYLVWSKLGKLGWNPDYTFARAIKEMI
jgi:nucleoside-diphosphate-sugar epimerase